MKKGIKITNKECRNDWYDPVLYPEGLVETDTQYIINNGGYHNYTIEKNSIISIEWYEICQVCGRELENGNCERCHNSFFNRSK